MGHFPSLPTETNLTDVFKTFPGGVMALMKYHDDILRSQGPLTIGEKEMISAFVSHLNKCQFCWNAHSMYAEMYGNTQAQVESLQKGAKLADVSEKMKPVFAFVEKLTLTPGDVGDKDSSAILDAGWDERALNDIIHVTALYNFMNRIIHGSGISPHTDDYNGRKKRIRKQPLEKRLEFNENHLGNNHYQNFCKSIGIED